MKIRSFNPIINENCTVLILGSMPGAESLRKEEYYGYPQNSFWRIMFALLGHGETDDYGEKKKMLLENKIALWDVIESCERQGSLDSAIKKIRPNDFEGLYKKYPNIKHVFFNGAKAHDAYQRYIGLDKDKSFVRLPSTSPAHAVGFEKKLSAWRKIFTMC